MKVICYEEGYDRDDGEEYDLNPTHNPRGLDGALLVVAQEFAEFRDDGDVNVVVVPADDEARALPRWRSDEDEPQHRMFVVETRVLWHPREVTTFFEQTQKED